MRAGKGKENMKSALLTTSSVNMTSSSSTGGMGSAGSMVCRAKLLSLRSRYVISGWSLLRKQQKMKEIPRPLLFLGAMAETLRVPPCWALDPGERGERRLWQLPCSAALLRPAERRNRSHPHTQRGGEEGRPFTCQIFLLRFDIYGPGNLEDCANSKDAFACLVRMPSEQEVTPHSRLCTGTGPDPLPSLQIPAQTLMMSPRCAAPVSPEARPASDSVWLIWDAVTKSSWMHNASQQIKTSYRSRSPELQSTEISYITPAHSEKHS